MSMNILTKLGTSTVLSSTAQDDSTVFSPLFNAFTKLYLSLCSNESSELSFIG